MDTVKADTCVTGKQSREEESEKYKTNKYNLTDLKKITRISKSKDQ